MGAAHYSTFDMNSGFWQVPMSPESKQYTAFTLGSMGLYECESMPFGLCNAPPTFQRLMLNCLGELNLTYCLIYLDDVIVFSPTEEEHLERMRVIFDRLREHGLKLKPFKCEVFKTEIILLSSPCEQERHPAVKEESGVHRPMSSAGHVHEGEIFSLAWSDTTGVSLMGFTRIAAPLYDLTSGENKDKKSERVDLPTEALEALNASRWPVFRPPFWLFRTSINRSSLRRTCLVKASGLFSLKSRQMDATILSLMRVGL